MTDKDNAEAAIGAQRDANECAAASWSRRNRRGACTLVEVTRCKCAALAFAFLVFMGRAAHADYEIPRHISCELYPVTDSTPPGRQQKEDWWYQASFVAETHLTIEVSPKADGNGSEGTAKLSGKMGAISFKRLGAGDSRR